MRWTRSGSAGARSEQDFDILTDSLYVAGFGGADNNPIWRPGLGCDLGQGLAQYRRAIYRRNSDHNVQHARITQAIATIAQVDRSGDGSIARTTFYSYAGSDYRHRPRGPHAPAIGQCRADLFQESRPPMTCHMHAVHIDNA
jgi:hypothetical protein